MSEAVQPAAPVAEAAQLRAKPVVPTFEGHLVRAALRAEAVRSRMASLIVLLELSPRNRALIEAELIAAQGDLTACWQAMGAYAAVLSCEGSA